MHIILNLKMNFSKEEFAQYLESLKSINSSSVTRILAPTISYLHYCQDLKNWELAAQSISHIEEQFGAYTGEVSAKQVASLGVSWAIIGHYERYKYFGETLEQVTSKARNALRNGINCIICVGDKFRKLEELDLQDLATYKLNQSQEILIAYEPENSIGSSKIDFTHIKETIENMRLYLDGLKLAKKVNIIYGGSVNYSNIGIVTKIPNIEGVLLGSASLKIEEISKIFEFIDQENNI